MLACCFGLLFWGCGSWFGRHRAIDSLLADCRLGPLPAWPTELSFLAAQWPQA